MEEQIYRICEQLISDGKTPTIGLIKTRLSSKVPLPRMVQILTHFNQHRQLILENLKSARISQSEEVDAVDDPMASEALILDCESCKHTQAELISLREKITELQAEVLALRSK